MYASALARRAPDVFDGVSPADLVHEALLTFLASKDALGWQPAKGDLATFLGGVIRHKFLDHLKRHRRQVGSVDQHPFREAALSQSAPGASIIEQLEVQQWYSHLMNRLSGQKDLQDVVAAAETTDGRHNSNQQIADVLGTTPRDVANRKRRILRLLFGVTK